MYVYKYGDLFVFVSLYAVAVSKLSTLLSSYDKTLLQSYDFYTKPKQFLIGDLV